MSEKFMNQLKYLGENIANQYPLINQPIKPITSSFDQQQVFYETIKKSLESYQSEFTGFIFQLAPFFVNHYNSLSPNEINRIWNIFCEIFLNLQNATQFFGFLQSLYEFSLKCHNVHDCFLEFLASPKERNEQIKPKILCTLYELLPNEFLFQNSSYFIPLMIQSFNDCNETNKITCILILQLLHTSSELLMSSPTFPTDFWNFVYSMAGKLDSDYPSLVSQAISLRESAKEFFAVPESFGPYAELLPKISDENIDIGDISLSILIRTLPLQSVSQIETFIPALIEQIEKRLENYSQLGQPIIDALESFITIDWEDETFEEKLRCSASITNGGLILYSYICSTWSEESSEIALRLIIDSFGNKWNSSILLSIRALIYNNVINNDDIKNRQFIPTIISFLSSESPSLVMQAIITLRELFHSNSLKSFDMQIITSYKRDNFPEIAQRDYFKMLKSALVSCKPMDQTQILRFISEVISKTQNQIIAYALSVFTKALEEIPQSVIIHLPICSIACHKLLETNDYVLQVSKFMDTLSEKSDIINTEDSDDDEVIFNDFDGINERLIQLTASLTEPQKIDVECHLANYLNDKRLEIFSRLIQQEQNFTNLNLLFSLIYFYNELPIDIYLTAVPRIFNECYKTNSFDYLQAGFSLASIILKSNIQKIKEMEPIDDPEKQILLEKISKLKEEIEHLIIITMQSHIGFLEGNQLADYESPSFRFYKLIKLYIKYYPRELLSAQITEEILDWIPQFPSSMLEPAIKIINVALNNSQIFTPPMIKKGYEILLNSLYEAGLENDSISVLCSSLSIMHENFPNPEWTHKLLEILISKYQETQENKDEELMLAISIILIDIFASDETYYEINPGFFHQFTLLLTNGIDDIDHQMVLEQLCTMWNKFGNLYPFYQDYARIFAYYFLADPLMLKKMNIDSDLINKVKSILVAMIIEHNELGLFIRREYGRGIRRSKLIDDLLTEALDKS